MKKLALKSKRLSVIPMDDSELECLIKDTADEGLCAAYGEMLSGSRENPEQRLFYTAWKFCLDKSGETVGSACFKGVKDDGSTEIGYGINPGFEGRGYATEAVGALILWAFGEKGVKRIYAQTETGNKSSQRVLEKLGFLYQGEGSEGLLFSLESPHIDV